MSLIKETEDYLSNILKELGYEDSAVIIESNVKKFGDFQLDLAMALAKKYHQNPREIASKIVSKIDNRLKDIRIEGPGFINFKFNDDLLIKWSNSGIKDFNIFVDKTSKKKIIVDYGGANAAKSLHVGHMRSANIGEALKRLAKLYGNDVLGDVHLGDLGRQSGMLIYELHEENPSLPFFDENYSKEYPNIGLTAQDLGRMYPLASKKAKEDPVIMEKVREISSLVEKGYKPYLELWKQMLEVSSKEIKKVYDKLNCHFEIWDGELESLNYVPNVMEIMKKNLYESDGALIMDVKEKSDTLEVPPLMVIKSNGSSIYATRDLATLYKRINKYNPDEIWYVVDERQSLYFTQVFRGAYKSGLVPGNVSLKHFGFGTINGKDGKPFKTRDGGVMELSMLIEMIRKEIYPKIKEDIPLEERNKIADTLAIATLKYADLLPYRKTDYVFDPVKFSSLVGKTGIYILYSVVRMKSLLKKTIDKDYVISDIYNDDLKDILNKLVLLPKYLYLSYKESSLNYITEYLYQLVCLYNKFYNDNNILNEEDIEKKESYIALTKLVYNVVHNILNILAIDEVDRM